MKTENNSLVKLNGSELSEDLTNCDIKPKNKERDMEKVSTSRQPCEGEDHSEEKICNNTPPDKSNDLSGTPTDAEAEDVSKLTREMGSLRIRGPNGGKPSVQHYPHNAGNPMPLSFGYSSHTPQTYSMQELQRGKGRRMDEEDQPPTKFYNPDAMNGQGYNIQEFNYFPMQSHVYPPAQHIIGGSANKSGGIVTVTSPTKALEDPGFEDLSYGDKFLETCNGGPEGPGIPCQYSQMSQPPMNILTSNPSSVSYPNIIPTTVYSNNRSPVLDLGLDFKQQSFINSQGHRRRSDPSDSGVESAEERSPYTEPICSPQSNYMNPSSVDSGFERSPQHDPFYQDNHSQSSTSGGSPPAYPATPSPSSTSGYGSPGMPVMKDSPDAFSQDSTCDGSAYIDENLDNLSMALDVIAKDMQQTAERNRRQAAKGKCNQLREAQNIPNIVAQHNPPPPPPHHGGISQMVPCTTTVMTSLGQPVSTRPLTKTAAPILPPNVATAMNPQQVSQQLIILPPSQPPTTSSSVLLVPMTGPTPVTGPLIIVNGNKASPTPPKNKLRNILPRPPTSLPASVPSSASSASSACSSPSSSTQNSNKMTTTAGSSGSKPSPRQQTTAPAPQTKLLNIARRTVADIPRDGLQRYDDEGDTYLHLAVCKTDRYMVQALLERLQREGLMSLIDQGNNKRQTPLYLAVAIKQPVMVNMLIQFNADVNTLSQSQSPDCHTSEVKAALHVAASQGSDYLRTMQELLKAPDISINIVNNLGQTALHCAIEAHGKPKPHGEGSINSIPIIQMLIKRGADASAQDMKSGKTPLMYAIEQKDLALVQAILTSVETTQLKNVVKKQAFDGSSCLKIAEGLKDMYNIHVWNQLWNDLQNAASGDLSRVPRKV